MKISIQSSYFSHLTVFHFLQLLKSCRFGNNNTIPTQTTKEGKAESRLDICPQNEHVPTSAYSLRDVFKGKTTFVSRHVALQCKAPMN